MPAVSAIAPRSAQVDLSVPTTQTPRRQRCQDSDDCERSADAAPRRNPLVAAMMQALGSLMPSSAPAAAQDTMTVAADKPAATTTSSELKDAATAFAHELFDALRSMGSGRDSGGGGDKGAESGRGHSHHHHHGHGHGYGDLAQRLERLAGEVATPAQAAPSDSGTLSITASLTTASVTSTSDAATGSTSTSVNLTTVKLSLTQQNGAAEAAKESPLLSAFRKLFDALQPATSSDAAKPDAASGLSSFLRQLAQSLRGGRDDAAAALPTQGSLISVAA